MRKFVNCPHCGSGVWIFPIDEPNCEVCGCDATVAADHDEAFKLSSVSRPKRRSNYWQTLPPVQI